MWRGIIFIFAIFAHTAVFAGFLAPAEFPKTAADLSFVDRMALNAAGYEPYESEYDENGKCISGCSYAQPNIEEEINAMERWNALVKKDLVENYDYTENDDGTINAPFYDDEDYDDEWEISFPDENPMKENEIIANTGCAERNTAFENRAIPYRSPLGHVFCITSGYGIRRTINGKTRLHYGIDLRAGIGTPLYAPVSGTVVAIYYGGTRCGRGLTINHANGYSTSYCHLSQVTVTKGQQISAGCLIGKTGNTGASTGPHLHYAVKKNGNAVNPKNFIESRHKMCR
ncbi:MAG: M23 family metallopeptidase [Alphaproteobacteria bacterium]|nr:M23 family metallopeptidase [Alphaproteobacteria bacterium]